MSIQIKRIYEKQNSKDGKRLLVDRIWPRGISKQDANLDEWLKEVAPSPDLRKWFNHDPERYEQFKKKYKKELDNDEDKSKAIETIQKLENDGKVTLLYAAKDVEHNHANVLKEYLESK
ncbi:DUF488 domain-containing protein [Pseudalkalibacillus berkeleyi]|uniref:DUF488 domain-containing protein n=1 Tax=Pseudalkalibacillus berkeleyi TaxID=1069813 RepID=A0ABS9H4K1_9BACL|nr:DUF488 domain-containing protein [Pseudalkalibacillus berkeleyi]MCF6139021.1 DUF488 domain-containing protein [Pseudalkalibacillus berkeleyi]